MVTVNKMLLVAVLERMGQDGLIEVLADQGNGPQILLLGSGEIASGIPTRNGVLMLGAEREV